MAFSNNPIYKLKAGSLVTAAFKKIGVQPAEQPLQAFELQDGIEALNLMLKTWQSQNFHLWTMKEGVVFLEPLNNRLLIGQNGDHNCDLSDFVPTVLTASADIGDTVLTVASTTNMAAADFIGIKTGTLTREWTTIASVDSSTQLTISAPLTADASSKNSVFTYTTPLYRPSRIPSVRRVTYPQETYTIAEKVSRSVFYNQSTQNNTGVVSMFYYDPQLLTGQLMVWETGQNSNDYLRITYQEYIDSVETPDEDIYIPPEWQECVVYNLASRLCDDYNVPIQKTQRVQQYASIMLQQCLGYDEEPTKYAVIANYNNYNSPR